MLTRSRIAQTTNPALLISGNLFALVQAREEDRSGIVEPYVYAFPLLKCPLDKAMDVLFFHWRRQLPLPRGP